MQRNDLKEKGWFNRAGAYFLFDGQFGSAGKGVLASWMAHMFQDDIELVTTNAGPNSGHTFLHEDEVIVTRQLPVAGVVLNKMGYETPTYLNAGSVIDPDVLRKELETHKPARVYVHPNAAVIDERDREQNKHIASTGSGTGPAIARKVSRPGNTRGTIVRYTPLNCPYALFFPPPIHSQDCWRTLVEVPQGYSLGINRMFYPFCTARECTPVQALLDLGWPIQSYRKSIVALRAYPIRTGSLDEGSSGPAYPDQREIEWDEIGREPEISTVTGRERRLFTWSWQQYRDMLRATQPDALFLNFLNYIDDIDKRYDFIGQVKSVYVQTLGRQPDFVLHGHGPTHTDIFYDPDFDKGAEP